MKKIALVILILLCQLYSNDSEYYTSGNQLVPLTNSNVRLDKEVLKIKTNNTDEGEFYVDVLYHLFNEGDEKNIIIGFESTGQVGDSEPEHYFDKKYDLKKLLNAEKKAIKSSKSKNKNNYVKKFKVVVNKKVVKYKIANFDNIGIDKYTSPYVGWLYYFPVHLKKGKNIIHQTYIFSSETSVNQRYGLSYILSTAQRWKGGKIKDFTLILDFGEIEQFNIEKTFFTKLNNWQIQNGFIKDSNKKDSAEIYILNQKAVFHKTNFTPKGTILLTADRYFPKNGKFIFNYKEQKLPFQQSYLTTAVDKLSLKILKAQPFARRGYLFKNKKILNYYKQLPWFRADKNYKKSFNNLSKQEKKWLKKLHTIELKILRNMPYAKRGYAFKTYALSNFFENQAWYNKNKQYKANYENLNAKEKRWINKIDSLKKSNKIDFFKLLKEYNKLIEKN